MLYLIPGRIVYPEDAIPDPQGKNPKEGRPFVVVSKKADIAAGRDLDIVGITSDIRGDFDEVPLPFGYGSKTKLSWPSVALCRWTATVSQKRVHLGGIVRPTDLRDILIKLAALDEPDE